MAFPIEHDLVIRQGSDFARTFRWLTGLPEKPRWRDAWDPTATFVKNDVTMFDTVFYVALARNKAAEPDVSPDAWEPLSPKDLTDFTARLMAREHKVSEPALSLTDTLSGDGSGFVLGGTAGTIRMQVANETTDGLPDAVLAYDLELVSPDDAVTPFMAGQITIAIQVTHE